MSIGIGSARTEGQVQEWEKFKSYFFHLTLSSSERIRLFFCMNATDSDINENGEVGNRSAISDDNENEWLGKIQPWLPLFPLLSWTSDWLGNPPPKADGPPSKIIIF